jgi:hypothetical protein
MSQRRRTPAQKAVAATNRIDTWRIAYAIESIRERRFNQHK